MNLKIEEEVFQKFNPDLKIAFLLVENIDNKSKLKESLHLLREAEQMVHLTFNKDTIKNHNLIAPWAVAQEKFGKKAKHYHTSVEKLLKAVLKRKGVSSENVLTNLLHYLALKHVLPFGVDDLEKINGSLTFALAGGKEKVDVLRKVKKGVFYYHDKKNVLGTKLDYWKSKKTALDKNSTSALVHFEALPPLDKKKLDALVNEAVNLVGSFCGGKSKVFVLDKKKSSVKV